MDRRASDDGRGQVIGVIEMLCYSSKGCVRAATGLAAAAMLISGCASATQSSSAKGATGHGKAQISAKPLGGTSQSASGPTATTTPKYRRGSGSHQSDSTTSTKPSPSSSHPDKRANRTSSSHEATIKGDYRDKPRNSNQSKLVDSIPGKHSEACVTVGPKTRAARSGDVAVAGIQEAREMFSQKHAGRVATAHLQVIPGNSKGVKSVSVLITSPKGTSKHQVSTDRGTANGWVYFSVPVSIKGPGMWTLKVSGDSGSGCFKVQFSR